MDVYNTTHHAEKTGLCFKYM